MNITEIRAKLVGDNAERLKAFCSITIDGDFVIRDLKVIDGSNGLFVAMPSRKLSDRCPKCGMKNHLRARFCNECGAKLGDARASRDTQGRTKLHADIAHPINAACRERLQEAIVEAFEAEVAKSQEPGYEPQPYDEEELEGRALAVARDNKEDKDNKYKEYNEDDADEADDADDDFDERGDDEDAGDPANENDDYNSLIADLKGRGNGPARGDQRGQNRDRDRGRDRGRRGGRDSRTSDDRAGTRRDGADSSRSSDQPTPAPVASHGPSESQDPLDRFLSSLGDDEDAKGETAPKPSDRPRETRRRDHERPRRSARDSELPRPPQARRDERTSPPVPHARAIEPMPAPAPVPVPAPEPKPAKVPDVPAAGSQDDDDAFGAGIL